MIEKKLPTIIPKGSHDYTDIIYIQPYPSVGLSVYGTVIPLVLSVPPYKTYTFGPVRFSDIVSWSITRELGSEYFIRTFLIVKDISVNSSSNSTSIVTFINEIKGDLVESIHINVENGYGYFYSEIGVPLTTTYIRVTNTSPNENVEYTILVNGYYSLAGEFISTR